MAHCLPRMLSDYRSCKWIVCVPSSFACAGAGTDPVAAPPSRSYRAFKDVQARHPAFAEAPEASRAPSVADTGQLVDRGITDMQS